MDQHPFLKSLDKAKLRPALYTSNFHLYIVTPQFLIENEKTKNIVTWMGNRPADLKRVDELRIHMKETHRCPGTICLAIVKNQVVCYDGNHRRLALTDEIPHVCVDVMISATDEMVKKEFENVNKSIQVPVLYINPQVDTAAVKNEILSFVKVFTTRYHAHVSGSRNPNRPNFNRDVFIDDLTELSLLHRDDSDIKVLLGNITKLNVAYSEGKLISKAGKGKTSNMIEKCEASGLWLFLDNYKINRVHLKEIFKGDG
ncbi:Hypothetical protein POVR1_LOCUS58 [uncultured virus]|nr:Hypothetical protein POVR1_LOCUS58 [uncultured virus]